jgi:hypothetical protein
MTQLNGKMHAVNFASAQEKNKHPITEIPSMTTNAFHEKCVTKSEITELILASRKKRSHPAPHIKSAVEIVGMGVGKIVYSSSFRRSKKSTRFNGDEGAYEDSTKDL